MTILICCVLAFLVGGIPFGFLVGRFVLKDDIRNHGSGNIGATNVARVIGWNWGGFVLLLDAIKGLLPTWLALRYAADNQLENMILHLPVAAGISAIVGHMYPVYLKLRGGKGVATALGVVLVLAPKAVAIALAAFLLTVAVTRIVAVASIVAALTFGGVQLYLMRDTMLDSKSLSLTVFAIAIPLLIIWRHRSNIRKLVSGEAPPPPDSPASDVPASDSDNAVG
ncbi:glycerol-3-phosphate 1-O-acyltransferase PlsY [Fuerstiella marisgermanici]|uniref:Glycerol-3-phosphate acyltransferase n=1 Tax=Fuerstiella marisgermanici TaxID=1891926 RepID=A0A1P8WS60_9PLAN|nr:glycerol-3-phosphate 1-O-acyltransferase PlsY [Fuerstiella marisgermanici]APZ96886.1 G3P acyltransferase [Fuerstiella marisgermanici]